MHFSRLEGVNPGLQFSFVVAAGACCGSSNIFSAASIALRRFNTAVGLHRKRPLVINLISTLPSDTAFKMRDASSIWIAPPMIPVGGRNIKINERRRVDVFINGNFVLFGWFGHCYPSLFAGSSMLIG